ncbi:uncharacterized protein [Asterias amurensis]|uniref:uncharacterized protein isoform X1 n=1 Tax=Asterias amurensis TaxID=7602 RepID=UPI003AB6F628
MDLRLLLLSQLLASLIVAARSLSCYYCIDEDGAPDSTEECYEPGVHLLHTCPERTTQCVVFEGVSSRPTGDSMSGVVRMCGPPVTPPLNTTEAPQQELPENRCYCDAEAADWFKKFLPVLDPGDLIVEGAICFCDHNGCNND